MTYGERTVLLLMFALTAAAFLLALLGCLRPGTRRPANQVFPPTRAQPAAAAPKEA